MSCVRGMDVAGVAKGRAADSVRIRMMAMAVIIPLMHHLV